MYKISQFYIAQPGFENNEILLYSTLTTAMIELENDIYTDIFEKLLFDKYPDLTQELLALGFLIAHDFVETEYLEDIRKTAVITNSGAPTYYMITPTMDCNARCYYCFEHGAHHEKMNLEVANALADYIIANRDPDHLLIQWFGGEPLLEPDIIDVISKKLIDSRVTFAAKITTNGYLLTPEIIQKAKNEWNVQVIQITIDDIGENYNKIKNYIYKDDKNPFQKVIANIHKALDEGMRIRIRINFNPIEYEKTIFTVRFLNEEYSGKTNLHVYLAPIDSESKQIPPITGEFSDLHKHPIIALLDAEEGFCSFGNYKSGTEIMSDIGEDILQKYYLNPIPTSCYGGCESSLNIDSRGDFYVCHRLFGRKEFSSGNVFEGRMNNEIAMSYKNPVLLYEKCNQCELLPICQGGCKYRAFKYGKSHMCTPVKGAVKELIKRAALEMKEYDNEL